MNTAQRKAMEQALEALEAMKAEFRALDLPYGSKAYTQGNHASHELRAALAEQAPVAADDAGIYEFWARDKESEQKASKELDPKDIWVELIAKPVGGFAPTMTNGVRLTHRPTGISVEETDERSSHKNKHIAWEKLKQLVAVAAAEQSAEPATNIGCLGMPVNTPVTAPQPAKPAMQEAIHRVPIVRFRKESGTWVPYYTAPQPAKRVPLTDEEIDRVLGTPIPGGSNARDWFLPHETTRGLANVRCVVRLMIEAAHGITSEANGETE